MKRAHILQGAGRGVGKAKTIDEGTDEAKSGCGGSPSGRERGSRRNFNGVGGA